MSLDTRVYVITDRKTDQRVRLVSAANPSQALRHVANDQWSAIVASQRDLIDLLPTGITVENARAEEAQ